MNRSVIPIPVLALALLAPALLGAAERWGYIDTTGNWVIRPQYKQAFGFIDSDWSAVECADDSTIYIDRTGQMQIPKRFCSAYDFCEGRAFADKDGFCGLIDTTGNFLSVLNVDLGLEFSGGRGAVQMGENWGYVDRDGKLAVFPQFAEAESFHEGLAVVCPAGDGELLYGCIDTLGDMVIPARYSDLVNFSDGLARFRRPDENGWGFIDHSGRVVIDTGNGVAGDFSEGLAMVQRNGQCGYIDATGKTIIEPRYEGEGQFSEGLAAVKQDGKWGYIDRTGQVVIPAQFDIAREFSEGRALVNTGGEYRFMVGFVGGTTCFIDRAGKPVTTLPLLNARSFHRGLAAIEVAEE